MQTTGGRVVCAAIVKTEKTKLEKRRKDRVSYIFFIKRIMDISPPMRVKLENIGCRMKVS